MKRKIVKIDEEKCIGCGFCITGCQEGALKLVNGKAKLVSDTYCDGLGACLPVCPVDAIAIEEREAALFDEAAVNEHIANKVSSGCPGMQSKLLEKSAAASNTKDRPSALSQWPCQIKLVPIEAAYFANAELLIAADCTAYAYAAIHEDFMRGKITLIGCPKLDDGDYAEKLSVIFARNEIKSITVLRMEVPCCGGLVSVVTEALSRAGKVIPCQVAVIKIDGKVAE